MSFGGQTVVWDPDPEPPADISSPGTLVAREGEVPVPARPPGDFGSALGSECVSSSLMGRSLTRERGGGQWTCCLLPTVSRMTLRAGRPWLEAQREERGLPVLRRAAAAWGASSRARRVGLGSTVRTSIGLTASCPGMPSSGPSLTRTGSRAPSLVSEGDASSSPDTRDRSRVRTTTGRCWTAVRTRPPPSPRPVDVSTCPRRVVELAGPSRPRRSCVEGVLSGRRETREGAAQGVPREGG